VVSVSLIDKLFLHHPLSPRLLLTLTLKQKANLPLERGLVYRSSPPLCRSARWTIPTATGPGRTWCTERMVPWLLNADVFFFLCLSLMKEKKRRRRKMDMDMDDVWLMRYR